MESRFGSNSMMEFEAKIPQKFGLPYYKVGKPFKNVATMAIGFGKKTGMQLLPPFC